MSPASEEPSAPQQAEYAAAAEAPLSRRRHAAALSRPKHRPLSPLGAFGDGGDGGGDGGFGGGVGGGGGGGLLGCSGGGCGGWYAVRPPG